MILKVFDSGWPAVMLIPNMIRDVRDRILNKYTVNRPTILVNSTWYTDDVDQQVQKYIMLTPILILKKKFQSHS